MSSCGTQTASERTPSTTAADAAPPSTATAPPLAPPVATPSPVTPDTAAAAPPSTAPSTGTDDGGVPTTTPSPDGGAPAGVADTAGTPGGDEAGNRVPVSFTVSAGAATPATITVPPFLGILLRGTSGDGKAHAITVRSPPGGTLAVPASGFVTRALEGLPVGSYPVEVDGQAVATLRVADDAVGP